MDAMELVGLNTKYYRYKKNMTQEKFSEITGFKMAYISTIESGNANLTCKTIDLIASSFEIKIQDLFVEATALEAKKLPKRVDTYYRALN